MGLFGALFAGVSGLDSQSNKIGIISNNISNVNTVGYKQGQADFDTLVVPSGTTSFSPGGTIGGNQQLVNQQGIISGTSSATDIAISGNGFAVVSSTASGFNNGGNGTELYTRAGSFTQDATGNFVNSDGYYLQGIKVSNSATTVSPNNQNLVTVSVNQNATGSASATSGITVNANLNATQTVFPGASITATMQTSNGTSAFNTSVTGSQILIGNDVPTTETAANNLQRGAQLKITSTPSDDTNPTVDTFTYGGFTLGRNVGVTVGTSAASKPYTTALNGGGLGDGATGNYVLDTENGVNISTDGTTGTLTINVANVQDYATGNNFSISGVASNIGGLTPAEINGEWQIASVTPGAGTSGTITVNVGVNSTSAQTNTGTVSNRTTAFTGNILNATSTTADFLASGTNPLTTGDFAADALHFDVSVDGNTPVPFTYSATPNPSAGTFNNMTTLAEAISDSTGLSATIQNGRLYLSGTNPNQSVVVTNGDAAGNATGPGIDWVQELGISNTELQGSGNSGTHLFNSLSSLASEVNSVDPTNLTAAVTNPDSAATLSITEANPEQTVSFSDSTSGQSILKELGVTPLVNVANTTNQFTTGVLDKTYDPTVTTENMSSGKVTPQFTHDITVYDAQGNSHTVALNFIKLGTNTWGVEATAVPATDVKTQNNDGLLGYGTLTFNGDGTLATDSLGAVTADWTNGAAASTISVDFGLDASSGDASQLTQASGSSTMQANQNGAPTGELTGVSIDQNGFVIAAFSNGQTQKLYQIPLAVVSNPDGMESVSGDAYQETLSSGQPTLNYANSGGAGQFTPSALEQSNVDLSTQLTDLIVAQQAYGANSKLLTVADSLLQELDQIIQ